MTAAYIRHSLGAAWRIARFDPNAISEFDASYSGFFRSFVAVIVCLPLYLIILLGERKNEIAFATAHRVPVGSSFAFYTVESVSYLLNWLALPVIMLAISPLIGANGRYVPFVVAYNWGTCLVFAALVAPYVLLLTGLIPGGAVLFLYSLAVLFCLVYRWRIAREGLQVSVFTASGIVILDMLVGIFLTLTSAKLRGV